MNTNDLKKVLYKEKVEAIFVGATSTSVIYETTCSFGKVEFLIPTAECTDGMFERLPIKASLLIRWIYKTDM